MSSSPLNRAVDIISAAPQSARALQIYALMSTLALKRGGCLYKLDKLRDWDAADRQLAYQLMELMAVDEPGTSWDDAMTSATNAIRGGA